MKPTEDISGLISLDGEFKDLMLVLEKESAQRRKMTRHIRVAFVIVFGLLLIQSIISFAKGKPFDAANLLIYGSLIGTSCAYGLSPRLRQSIEESMVCRDKRFLGAMIEALDSGDPELKSSLEIAVTRLLILVNQEDMGLLSDLQLDKLWQAVRLSTDINFCVAGIRALGTIGTSRSLHNLDILLNDPFIPESRRSKMEPTIKAAMVELRIRLAKELLAPNELDDTKGLAMTTFKPGSISDSLEQTARFR